MNSEKIIRKCTKSIKENLKRRPSAQILIYNVTKFQDATDELASTRLRDTPAPYFECKRGCTHCCSLRVEALPPELFRIAKHINEQPADVKEGVLEKLREAAEYAKGKKFIEYTRPCTFLTDEGACSIYSVRPHKCRKYFSMSVSHCVSNNTAQEDVELYEAENNLAGHVVQLYKKVSLVMHPYELAQGVLQVLENTTLIDRWAKGEQVFELLPERIEL